MHEAPVTVDDKNGMHYKCKDVQICSFLDKYKVPGTILNRIRIIPTVKYCTVLVHANWYVSYVLDDLARV